MDSSSAASTEPRLFIRFYAVGPSEDTGKLRRALDDLLVGDIDWPESIDWALSAEAADGWLIDLLQDMREGNTQLLRPVEARVDDSAERAQVVRTPEMFVIDCAHYAEELIEDNMDFLTAVCACGWRCPPCPDEEARTDFLMQHAYEAGILTERNKRGS